MNLFISSRCRAHEHFRKVAPNFKWLILGCVRAANSPLLLRLQTAIHGRFRTCLLINRISQSPFGHVWSILVLAFWSFSQVPSFVKIAKTQGVQLGSPRCTVWLHLFIVTNISKLIISGNQVHCVEQFWISGLLISDVHFVFFCIKFVCSPSSFLR